MKNYITAIIFLALTYLSHSQNEASFWYFGRNAGLNFNSETGEVTALTNGRLNTLEGCTSISDSNGDLLFYSDGSTIWNRDHEVMLNGTGLKGDNSSTSSGLIVPKPQDPNFYYLFTVDEPHHANFSGYNGDDIDPLGDGINSGLLYSRININDDGGLGAVELTEKNVPLVTYDINDPVQSEFKCSEKITAVRADDCSSFWVISHFVDSFYAFKVDTNGVSSTPVVSTVGPTVPVMGYRRNALGYIKASPDGTKIVVAHFGFSNVFGGDAPGGVYLFDFDNDTGVVSNSLELYGPENNSSPYGVEFSAENRKVYASIGGGPSGGTPSRIIQWDLEAADIQASQFEISSDFNVNSGALQLGIDRRIYRAQINFNNFNQSGEYLGIIQNPEASGEDVNYSPQGILLDVNGGFQNLSSIGLPPFIQSLFNSQIDIIRNGVSTTELNLCDGDRYTLQADEIQGAEYTWFKDGAELLEDGFELEIDSNGFYEIFVEPNNGECPIEGTAVVGVFEIPIANGTGKIEVCDDNNDGVVSFDFSQQTADILGSQSPTTYQVQYYKSFEDAESNINVLLLPYDNSESQETIFASIQNINNTACSDITSFELEVFGTPVIDISTFEVCDEDGNITDGIAETDLSALAEEIEESQDGISLNISFHGTRNDAELGTNELPLNYTNSTPGTETVFVRAENTAFTSCSLISELTLIINPAPIVNNASVFQCDEDGNPNGITRFNLSELSSEISNNEDNRDVEFYLDLTDAISSNNPINGGDYENVTPLQIVFTKVINTDTGCVNFGELVLEVSTTAANDAVLAVCDYDGEEDGFTNFNLSEADTLILSGLPAGLDLAYYPSFDDALLETNVLPLSYTNETVESQTIFVRVENENACYGISELELRVQPLPNIETEFKTIYCLNTFPEAITLDGGVISAPPNNFLYEWSTGENTAEIEVNEPGTYSVKVFNTLGCFKERTINVVASNVATIGSIDVTDGAQSNSISFSVSGEGDYEFALNDIDGPYQNEPFFDNLPPELYTLYVRDKNGCGITEQDVSVIGFPRFFTPNGDGRNDFWQIKGITSRSQLRGNIQIFDRFGKLLRDLDPTGPGWDGRYNGDLLPSNDYWFTAVLEDGRAFTSHFSLKR
ncbi:MAG: T9SS type B sorting domain-containing protein [Bacteroidota bacterium]